MSKVKKRARVITAFSASMLLSLAIAGGASADTTTDKAPGALTSPPPVEMNIMSVNPMNLYLSDTMSSIRKSSSGMQLSGNTYASQVVDSIGVHFFLQRWTGSLWVDAETNSDKALNTSAYYGTKSFSAISGYYYRGKTVHWVKKGTSYEEATMHTETLLMGN